MSLAVHEVIRKICQEFKDAASFPTSNNDVRSAMNGFKSIVGLPYCVGAIDGTHIPWLMCPSNQYYD